MNPDDIDAICKLFELDLQAVGTVGAFIAQANRFDSDIPTQRWFERLFPRRDK